MSSLIPNRFLFKFEFPVHRCAKPPAIDGRADRWNERWILPALHGIENQLTFGDVYVAWHESGLYVACRVHGKSRPPRCEVAEFRKSDHLRIMTDMRDTRTIRRASRFCQHFFLLPAGGGKRSNEAIAGAAPIDRSVDRTITIAPGEIPIASQVTADSWSVTAHLPADKLNGYDPVENPRIGLYYMIEDAERGQQYLTVGDDLNWWFDPSTWATAVLSE